MLKKNYRNFFLLAIFSLLNDSHAAAQTAVAPGAQAILSPAAEPAPAPRGYSMGTGFFVSYDGHVVTNAHVVRGCKSAIIRGTVPSTPAEILKVDEKNDLALLQANVVPLDIATLSTSNLGLKKDDRVMLIGYPGNHSMTGLYKVVESTVASNRGPRGEANWVQFKNAADHGNSGGPLLDATGNVIGVVQGHVILSAMNPLSGTVQPVSESDVAISLPILMPFLDQSRVAYQRNPNNTNFSANTIEDKAKRYIVNVVCETGS